ncbi:MAG: hypothetical protein ACREM3_14080 [Candidatus Rokuibacteriota bacterium]
MITREGLTMAYAAVAALIALLGVVAVADVALDSGLSWALLALAGWLAASIVIAVVWLFGRPASLEPRRVYRLWAEDRMGATILVQMLAVSVGVLGWIGACPHDTL